jgi:hypothetical protein
MQPTGDAYPSQFTFDPPERIDNWRPLVQWLLAIPHFLVVGALLTVARILAVVSWFTIVFTGALPESLANFLVMYQRYNVRVNTYAGFLRSEYPPFTFDMTPADPGNDPRVRVDVRPELENRNRATVGFRLILVIPQFIAVAVLFFASAVVTLISFFAVLFTGRWPVGMRDFVLSVSRYWLRVESYTLLLTDLYPPFALS